MLAYEIQIKVDGKWTQHSSIEASEADAMKLWEYVRGTLSAQARLVYLDYKGRAHVLARQGKRSGYRVTYGETAPVWQRVLPTLDAAQAFAAKHRSFGDIVFGIEHV